MEAIGTVVRRNGNLRIHTTSPECFAFILAPLMFIAFVLLIAAVGIASKNHEQTSRHAWTWLVSAGVAQILTFMALAALGKRS